MQTAFLPAAILGALICATPALAKTNALQPAGDRERFVSVVQSLEGAPLNPELQNDRAWAIQWLTDAPDISVNACLEPIGGVSEKAYAQAPIVVVQYMVAMAAFIIKHPEQQNDSDAQQLAGVESALRAYQAMRIDQPLSMSSALEKLLGMQNRGKLREFVHKAYRHCLSQGGKEVVPPIFSTKAQMWEKIWDQPNTAVIYADRSSVKGSLYLRLLTTRTDYTAPFPEGYIVKRVRVEEFDCAHNRSRIRSTTILAKDGRSPQTIDWAAGKSRWEVIDPDTLGAAKSKIACAARADAE